MKLNRGILQVKDSEDEDAFVYVSHTIESDIATPVLEAVAEACKKRGESPQVFVDMLSYFGFTVEEIESPQPDKIIDYR